MKYRKFTPDCPKVSEIGVGAWQLGINSGWKSVSENEAITMVHQALDRGVNFFDTAPNYGQGTSEVRLGKAFKDVDRSSIVVNTKFGHTDNGKTNYSADYIRASLEGSLRRMDFDYVDSLIIHNPPSDILDGNKNDHYEILEKLKAEGKIRAYGASLDFYDEMKLFMDTTGCEVIEAFFNIFCQDAGRAFDQALEKNVGIIVKIPLDSGWLTGKYNAQSTFTGVRSRWSQKDIANRAALVGKLKEIVGETYNLAQMAIAFCLAYDAVSTVIPGSLNMDQLSENIGSSEVPFSEEMKLKLERFWINEVQPLHLPW